MNFKGATIIHKEPHFKKRKIIEASYMKLEEENLPISQASVDFPALWLPIIRKELKRNHIKPSLNSIPENGVIKTRSHCMQTRSQNK